MSFLFIDPIQRFIDYQLRSRQARLDEIVILGCFPQISIETDYFENALIEAIDMKYFGSGRHSDRVERVVAYRLEGWTEREIGAFERVSHASIHKILKKIPIDGYQKSLLGV